MIRPEGPKEPRPANTMLCYCYYDYSLRKQNALLMPFAVVASLYIYMGSFTTVARPRKYVEAAAPAQSRRC